MNSMVTPQIDFVPKSFQLSDGSVVNCFIYDTCGQEKFDALNKNYYKSANAILLVYDISNRNSFDAIKDYYCITIKEFCKSNIPIILIGNKSDLENEREVSTEEGVELAIKEKFIFKESSCLKNENVADAFEALIEMWNHKHKLFSERYNPIKVPIKRNSSVYDKSNEDQSNNNFRSNTIFDISNNNNYDKQNSIILQPKKHEHKNKKCCQ